jgi:hypothetical protein
MKRLFFILCALICAVVAGCDKDKDDAKGADEVEIIEVPEVPSEPEPPKRYPGVNVGNFYSSFVGQWQQIDCGTFLPDSISKLYVKPSGYIFEFFEDSTARRSSTQYTNCRTDAEFLYYTLNGRQKYIDRYTFTGPDTLRLDYEYGLITTSVMSI